MTEAEAKEQTEKFAKQAEIDAEIKAKHKAYYKIVSDDGEHVAYLRKPSRLAVGIYLGQYEENPVSACEVIFNDAVVQEVSDVDFFNQDENFYGIVFRIAAIVSVKKSTLTTL